jgi:hypothetical protein
MKKWFFSNNGEITEPLDLDEAKDYLASYPDVYGWHPSFNQWKPVNCISEFVDVIPATIQAPAIPKAISDKFIAKKQRLESKLTSIDDSINHSQSSLGKFEDQIEAYKVLTRNLNDDVKGAIDNIEKKYHNLCRKLSQVEDAVQIAVKEMSVVVGDFDQRMSSSDVFMPSCNQSPQAPSNAPSNAAIDAATYAAISKAKIAQAKLATPHKRVDPVEAKKHKPANKVEAPIKEPIESDAEYANKIAKESFNGMKNMMKSVFKGDTQVEPKKIEPKKIEPKKVEPKVEIKKGRDEPLSMAERLKMAQNNQ